MCAPAQPEKLVFTGDLFHQIQSHLGSSRMHGQQISRTPFKNIPQRVLGLPTELFDLIISSLSGKDICHLSMVSKPFEGHVIQSVCRLRGGRVNWIASYGSFLKKVSACTLAAPIFSIHEKIVSYKLSQVKEIKHFIKNLSLDQTPQSALIFSVILKTLIVLKKTDRALNLFASFTATKREPSQLQYDVLYALCYSFPNQFHPKHVYKKISRKARLGEWSSFLAICLFKRQVATGNTSLLNYASFVGIPLEADPRFFAEGIAFCIETRAIELAITILKDYLLVCSLSHFDYTYSLMKICNAFLKEARIAADSADRKVEMKVGKKLLELVKEQMPERFKHKYIHRLQQVLVNNQRN